MFEEELLIMGETYKSKRFSSWFSNLKITRLATIRLFNRLQKSRTFAKKVKIPVGLSHHVSTAEVIGLRNVVI